VALPWGLAGAGRLLAAGWWPGAAGGRSTRSWLAIGAVPCGAATLLRLGAATGGAADPGFTVILATFGTAAALWGAVAAWRWKHESRRAGRALLTASAGTLVAIAGLPGGAGGVCAGVVALELALLAAPAWSRPTLPPAAAAPLAATALAAAGGLPIGFGTTAMVLELGAVSSLGRPYAPLLLALGMAAVIAAGGGVVAARQAIGLAALTSGEAAAASPPSGDGEVSPLRESSPVGGGVLPRGCFGAPCCRGPMPPWLLCWRCCCALPRCRGRGAAGSLVGSGAPVAIDAATLHGPGGPWPGGYLSLALLVVLLAVVSGGLALGSLPPPRARRAGAAAAARLGRRRRGPPALGPPARGLGRGLARLDSWFGDPARPRLHGGRGPRRSPRFPLPVNQPLLDLIAFAAGAVVVTVDRRRAVLVTCIAVALGLSPAAAIYGGGWAAVIVLGAGAAGAGAGPLAGTIAGRLGPRSGIDPLHSVATQHEGSSGLAALAWRPASLP